MGALMFYPASSENTEARPQTIPVRVKFGNRGARSVGSDVKCTLCQKYAVIYVDKYFGDNEVDFFVYKKCCEANKIKVSHTFRQQIIYLSFSISI